MTDDGMQIGRLSRRSFMAAMAGLAAAACSNDEGADSGGGTTTRPAATGSTTANTSLPAPPFTLGVASGDPTPASVMLWTRLAPEPLEGGGMGDTDVPVAWEIATDEAFTDVVASGDAKATAAFAHSVHIDADGLEPDTWYWYRFRAGGHESPVGRTRTTPAAGASVERLTIAVANCQDYAAGRYLAHRHLAADKDVDLVLFLGDYIYEHKGVDDPDEALADRAHLGEPTELVSYRTRYAQYRLDPDLQASHARAPWLLMWDDHEVENNYASDRAQDPSVTAEEFSARRLAAYQAFWEHQPIRLPRPSDTDVELWQSLPWGDLAKLVTIDVRSNSDEVPCRDTSLGDIGLICDEALAEDRSNLGDEQEEWLFGELASADATWTVLACPLLLSGLNLAPAGDTPRHFLELFDGYPAARRRIVEALATTPNPVVLSGDFHAAFACDVRADPTDPSLPIVASELLAPAISSTLFNVTVTDTNPHVRYFEARHGYLWCEVTPDRWRAEFRYVDDVTKAESPVEVGAVFTIDAGAVGLTREV